MVSIKNRIMKNLILASVLFISTFSFAQIKVVGEVKESEVIGSLYDYINITKRDNTYSVCYDDVKFTRLKSVKCFSFDNVNNDFENLYNLIMKGFDDGKKQTIELNLPDKIVYLNFTKTMGVVNFTFSQIDVNTGVTAFSSYLTKKKVQKLFGKD